jgi:hypothetical protein
MTARPAPRRRGAACEYRTVHLGLIVALASLAACRTVGPDYALPEGSAFKRPEANAAFIDTQNPQIAANQPLPARWWSLYDDPVLDGLISQALRDNVELKAADAHLRRAAAVYEQALDAGGFEYEAEAGVSRAQLSAESFLQEHELPVINLADGKFAVSYQFDLFGKLKRGAEAARADEQAVAAARDLAQVSVVAAGGGGQLGFVDPALPDLYPEPRHHADQGIDEHHRQGGVQDPEPVDRLHPPAGVRFSKH